MPTSLTLAGVLAVGVSLAAPLPHAAFAQVPRPAQPRSAPPGADSTRLRPVLADDDDTPPAPRLTYGVAAGGMRFTDGHQANASTVVLQYRPRAWALISAAPGFAQASSAAVVGSPTTFRSGITDLPVAVGAEHVLWAGRGAPTGGFTLVASLPTGNAATGVGSGATSVSADLDVGVSPRDGVDLQLGASRGLSRGAAAGLGLAGTALTTSSSVRLFPHLGASLTLGQELGRPDSTFTPARLLGAGLIVPLTAGRTLALEATHAIRGDGPRWGLTLAFGTAYANVSEVGATTALGRTRGAFVQRLTRNGKSALAAGHTCRGQHC